MPKVYENVIPRSFLQQGIDAMKEAGVDFFGTDNVEDLPFGVPDEMATAKVDATEFEPQKMKALAAHATQVEVDGPFFALSNHVGSRAWGFEFYRLVRGDGSRPLRRGRPRDLAAERPRGCPHLTAPAWSCRQAGRAAIGGLPPRISRSVRSVFLDAPDG